ncbi:MAG: UDP-N-acetylmuramate--L-alanine ligase [Candidatus Veblenbacteria bacterium RIFOXYB1_FULL_43_13]|uniref:UDP-N-acetylmuramate--L-alanine ligase n=1 Tax=Candidatus Veblenbacteria bacterium RIFOXYB1_FULL_43_13 TaxID=1802426 RepID=A0A1G2Q578_9BACT|nr:MAG: UDP-N-acetylmuramate--L-alanine ligase [Candidatus Veblenbacteria bacterium RIFOXYB1_FULL_43_13]
MSKFNQAKRIYFIGLKGVGMTALAQLLKSRGVQVWGSDTEEQFFTDKVLAAAGIECEIGFSAKHLDRPIDLVIRSSAYGDNQVEVKAAKEKKIGLLSYAEALGELTAEYQSVAVCGSHGKTTISAMLAHVLKQANLSPSAIVGSAVPQFGGNALVGSGELLVFEADEYQNKLQYFSPQSVILTSIDWDHPDFFPSADDYFATFVTFLKKIPTDGFVVACYDSDNVKEAVDKAGLSPEQILTYGLTDGRLQMVRMWLDEGRWHFSATDGEEYLGEFWLKLVGSHNVANALAVIACARRLGVDLEAIRTGLASFEGTARRFENKGKLTNGITVVDDYAHHPGEIKATLKAARAFYPYKNIRCVFQPHTFSRTQALLADFGKSFAETDEVIVLDTYTSAREKTGEVTSAQLVEEIKKNHTNVIYKPTISEAVNYLMETTNRNNLVLTMGAGDVWQVGDKLIEKFGLLSGSEF